MIPQIITLKKYRDLKVMTSTTTTIYLLRLYHWLLTSISLGLEVCDYLDILDY